MATFTNGTIGEGVSMIRVFCYALRMPEQKREYDHSLEVEAGKGFL